MTTNLIAGAIYALADLGLVEAVGTADGGWALLPEGSASSWFTVGDHGELTEWRFIDIFLNERGEIGVVWHTEERAAPTDFTVADLTLWEVRAS
jgi:hypothetical protein